MAMTLEAFDALPRPTAAEYLRALLVNHRLKPSRGSETLARFERWLAASITALPDDGTSQLVQRLYGPSLHSRQQLRNRQTWPDRRLGPPRPEELTMNCTFGQRG
jgi:hypothetical protein